MKLDYDLFIIGGGIHGVSTARDAAGRGMKVMLAEMNDLASGTSSVTSKYHHGGFRYVPQGQFGLVITALHDRERALKAAPHLTWPMKFYLLQDDSIRHYVQLDAVFAFYDFFARSKIIPRAHRVDFTKDPVGSFLKKEFTRGYCYGDGRTDDSRFTIANAMDARDEYGADIRTRTECTRLEPRQGYWVITLNGPEGEYKVTAKTVFNASGPWIEKLLAASGLDTSDVPKPDLIKGAHIITRKLYEGDHSYLSQQRSGQVIFVSPFEEFTRIGPTEEKFTGDPANAKLSQHDKDYLLNGFNRAYNVQLTEDDIIDSDCGVRQVPANNREVGKAPREHVLYVHRKLSAGMISVFGGKMTTARTLAEEAVDMVSKMQGKKTKHWTADAVLPGGDMPDHDFAAFLARKETQYAWLDQKTLYRYARAYGTRMDRFLEGARGIVDLGAHYGDGIYEAEVMHLKQNEWAQTADDVLRRRSKMYLTASPETVKNLELALA